MKKSLSKRKLTEPDGAAVESKYFKTSGSISKEEECSSTDNISERTLPKRGQSFFDVPCEDLAKALLGQRLVRVIDGQRVSGRIVETESYLGGEDKASHSHQGKRTARNEAMFMAPGTAYVYNIYGMYCCMNISSQGDGAAVLLRALEATEGHDVMKKVRGKKSKDKDLTNGPSKLCQALQIIKNDFNKLDLTTSDTIWIEQDVDVSGEDVIACPRINIGYAEEWTPKPLRFYVFGNPYVSMRDKAQEATHTSAKSS